MTTILLLASFHAGLIVSSHAFAQNKASQKFLKEAMEGNPAEVQMGQLAQKNGGSDRVRSFGQMLQKDHSDAYGHVAPNDRTAGSLSLPNTALLRFVEPGRPASQARRNQG